jgi:ferredoxin
MSRLVQNLLGLGKGRVGVIHQYTESPKPSVYCGWCVEACPCDAIRMDTRKFPESVLEGPRYIQDINYLMINHTEGVSKISEAIY